MEVEKNGRNGFFRRCRRCGGSVFRSPPHNVRVKEYITISHQVFFFFFYKKNTDKTEYPSLFVGTYSLAVRKRTSGSEGIEDENDSEGMEDENDATFSPGGEK